MSEPTITVPADSVIATTPEPVSESWQSSIESRLKTQPKIDRIDYSKVESGEVTPSGIEEVSQMDGTDFLKHLEDKSDPVVEPEAKEEPKTKKEDKKEKGIFDLDGVDLDAPVEKAPEEPKTKKSKEDNIAELRKKAEAFENEAKTKEDKLAEYQKRLDELEGELERTAFERSPKFKSKYETPYNNAVTEAQEFALEYADDASVAEKALSLKGRERIDFIDDTFSSGAAAASFLSKIEKADAARANLEGALTDYRNTAQQLQEEESIHRSKVEEDVAKGFDQVLNHLSSRTDFFRKGDDDEYNSIVDKRVNAARSIVMGTASLNDMKMAPFLAVLAKDAVEKLEKTEAELAKYKARAREDSSVTPRISRSSSDDNDERGSKPKSGLESIRSQLRGLN